MYIRYICACPQCPCWCCNDKTDEQQLFILPSMYIQNYMCSNNWMLQHAGCSVYDSRDALVLQMYPKGVKRSQLFAYTCKCPYTTTKASHVKRKASLCACNILKGSHAVQTWKRLSEYLYKHQCTRVNMDSDRCHLIDASMNWQVACLLCHISMNRFDSTCWNRGIVAASAAEMAMPRVP